jgi:deoxyhypusine synthase
MKHSVVCKTHLQNLKDADDKGERYLPHEFIKCFIRRFEEYYEIDLKDSWMYAAEKTLPIICPGWEDSTMGNIFCFLCH